MAKSHRKKKFHLTAGVVIRLAIFSLVVFLSIYYISYQNSLKNPNVLGEQTTAASDMPIVKLVVDNLYNQLPSGSRNTIENLNNSPIISSTIQKVNLIKFNAANFPQKQINDLKVYLLKKGSDLLKNAAEKSK